MGTDPLSNTPRVIDLHLSAINDVMFRWARGDLSDDEAARAIRSHLRARDDGN